MWPSCLGRWSVAACGSSTYAQTVDGRVWRFTDQAKRVAQLRAATGPGCGRFGVARSGARRKYGSLVAARLACDQNGLEGARPSFVMVAGGGAFRLRRDGRRTAARCSTRAPGSQMRGERRGGAAAGGFLGVSVAFCCKSRMVARVFPDFYCSLLITPCAIIIRQSRDAAVSRAIPDRHNNGSRFSSSYTPLNERHLPTTSWRYSRPPLEITRRPRSVAHSAGSRCPRFLASPGTASQRGIVSVIITQGDLTIRMAHSGRRASWKFDVSTVDTTISSSPSSSASNNSV